MKASRVVMGALLGVLGLWATACTSVVGVADLPSNTCGGVTVTTECEVCLAAQCCPQEEACAQDPQCTGTGKLYDCALACNSDQVCLNACGDGYPQSTIDEANAVLECQSQCDSACGIE
jgi:hypothetical protein